MFSDSRAQLVFCRFQNLKDQILTTNVWLEHVSIAAALFVLPCKLLLHLTECLQILGMGRSQIQMGAAGIRRDPRAVRAVGTHLATGHRAVQQVGGPGKFRFVRPVLIAIEIVVMIIYCPTVPTGNTW